MSGAPGLYIHVPFCARVCPYCDFAVQTGGPRKRAAYARALLREIRAARWPRDQPFDTVYFGGGTPSSLPPDVLRQILVAARESLPMAPEVLITLEANPEDVTTEGLRAWRELGVNRLSLGVQSFDPEALKLLGRTHSPDEAAAALEAALAAPLGVVSLDLIYGVPGQSSEKWETTLERAIALQPDHISCYELTVHEGTRFFRSRERGELVEIADDDKAGLFFSTHGLLAGAGYEAYEVSNFAREPGQRSLHNRKYWDHSPYLGLGPSAHSFDGIANRWWSERRLDAWIEAVESGRPAMAGAETLNRDQLVLEALALGLRTAKGLDLHAMTKRYGADLVGPNADLIRGLMERGFLEEADDVGRLVPTLEGLAIADTLAASFRIPSN